MLPFNVAFQFLRKFVLKSHRCAFGIISLDEHLAIAGRLVVVVVRVGLAYFELLLLVTFELGGRLAGARLFARRHRRQLPAAQTAVQIGHLVTGWRAADRLLLLICAGRVVQMFVVVVVGHLMSLRLVCDRWLLVLV